MHMDLLYSGSPSCGYIQGIYGEFGRPGFFFVRQEISQPPYRYFPSSNTVCQITAPICPSFLNNPRAERLLHL